MPFAFGGDVGGARSTMTFPIPAPGVAAMAAATGAVAVSRIAFQLRPPSVLRNTPRPLMPVYRTRAAADDVGSSTRERASPAAPAPNVQFKPPSVERKTPVVDARYKVWELAGSTRMTLIH